MNNIGILYSVCVKKKIITVYKISKLLILNDISFGETFPCK